MTQHALEEILFAECVAHSGWTVQGPRFDFHHPTLTSWAWSGPRQARAVRGDVYLTESLQVAVGARSRDVFQPSFTVEGCPGSLW